MKKTLVSAILGLAAIASVQAQNAIQLYNYGTPSAGSIVYGTGALGGTAGQGVVGGGYTVGVYYALGDVTGAVNGLTGGATTQGGANNGSLASSGLTLGTGVGSTVALGPDGPGIYDSLSAFVINPLASANQLVTVMLVAYNGSSYEASTGPGLARGHSAAFTMTAVASPGFALLTGNFAGGFAVAPVPEPSTFALAGLGLAGLLIFRRRK